MCEGVAKSASKTMPASANVKKIGDDAAYDGGLALPLSVLRALATLPMDAMKLTNSRLQAVSHVQPRDGSSSTEKVAQGSGNSSTDAVAVNDRVSDLEYLSTAVHIDGVLCWERWS
mmetsp:Transcript_110595/g.277010  ORF Transcript_110595/g.277010 Transcript_110595/m.277010 type:complete len:116 (-) Transcript_110595:153-500(-)